MTKKLEPRHIAALKELRNLLDNAGFPDELNELLVPARPSCEGEHKLGPIAELNLRRCNVHFIASFGGLSTDKGEAILDSGDIDRAIALLEQARDYLKENVE